MSAEETRSTYCIATTKNRLNVKPCRKFAPTISSHGWPRVFSPNRIA